MISDLEDAELTSRLVAADPANAGSTRVAAGSTAAVQLRDAITGTAPAVIGSRRARRWARPLIAATVAAAVVAVSFGLPAIRPSSGSAYAASLVTFAKHSPRLLVGADGWQVIRADEDDDQTGEMTFANAAAHLDVFWVPGRAGKDSDKVDMTPAGHATIDGELAWIGTYGQGEYEAIWAVGNQTREARGTFADRGAFLAVAQTLHRVTVDAWLAAMPASVVDPDARAATVEAMLADIPQPRGFAAATLESSGLVLDRYQLGAQVTGAVTCAWLHQWVHGDAAQRLQAARAMATSRRWAILTEMNSMGDYPEVLWEYADAINGRPTAMTPLDSLEDSAKLALGC